MISDVGALMGDFVSMPTLIQERKIKGSSEKEGEARAQRRWVEERGVHRGILEAGSGFVLFVIGL